LFAWGVRYGEETPTTTSAPSIKGQESTTSATKKDPSSTPAEKEGTSTATKEEGPTKEGPTGEETNQVTTTKEAPPT
jgi:hypothetical protein